MPPIAGIETFRVFADQVPSTPVADMNEAEAAMEKTQLPLRRGTPALSSRGESSSCIRTPSASLPSSGPRHNFRRVHQGAAGAKTLTPRMPRAVATAYGGPAPPDARVECSRIGRVAEGGVKAAKRSEERSQAIVAQSIGEMKITPPVKPAAYRRTPARTAGVLSKLLFRVARPSGRDQSNERGFQSW